MIAPIVGGTRSVGGACSLHFCLLAIAKRTSFKVVVRNFCLVGAGMGSIYTRIPDLVCLNQAFRVHTLTLPVTTIVLTELIECQ